MVRNRSILLLTLLLAVSPCLAQKDGPAKVMRFSFDAKTTTLLFELGAAVTQHGASLIVDHVAPPERRDEPYRAVDLREGDTVLLLNRKRVKDNAALRQAYDATPAGTEVKLGIQRGNSLMSVAFLKADHPAGGTGGGMRVVLSGTPPKGTMIPALGAFVADSAASPKVTGLLPPDARPAGDPLKEGDLITAVNGISVETAAALSGQLEPVKQGETVTLSIQRGGSSLKIAIRKPNADTHVIIRSK